ncbi:hypothetical protein S7711_09630 [Stachybotrys chartarum IBT 7711]|uniref:Uncharacterized protein n=1 Tax=Stachybotrys chartarum (strain CBS 109288 / IBT 7711) TaxID=1280523 RepID=A0A084B6S0_STACB|nr:hypothetical protein S7711_09630 [Stachybotrys chartarum IBT 7711]
MSGLEVPSSIVGVASLFSSCVDAFAYFKATQRADTGIEELLLKLDIERTRLLVWGNESGIFSVNQQHSTLRNESTVMVLGRILTQIEELLTDAEKLQLYGVRVPGTPMGEAIDYVSANSLAIFRVSISRFWTRNASRLGTTAQKSAIYRTRWAIYDRERFQGLVDDVKDFVDRVYELVPVGREIQDMIIVADIESIIDISRLTIVAAATEDSYRVYCEAASSAIASTEAGTVDRRKVEEHLRNVELTQPNPTTLPQAWDRLSSSSSAMDPTFPLYNPICRDCGNIGCTSIVNRGPNLGRRYYKCSRCGSFITWNDNINIVADNPPCSCGYTSRLSRTSRGDVYYSCPVGQCPSFLDGSSPFEQTTKMHIAGNEEIQSDADDLAIGSIATNQATTSSISSILSPKSIAMVSKVTRTRAGVAAFLNENFDQLAQEDGWLQDLRECGMSSTSIADCILEALDTGPWISVTPGPQSFAQARPMENFHQATCAHRPRQIVLPSQNQPASKYFAFTDRSVLAEIILSCGLAGFLPPSFEQDNYGRVSFSGKHARVTFGSSVSRSGNVPIESIRHVLSSPEDSTYVERILAFQISRAFDLVHNTLSRLQTHGACCNGITVLIVDESNIDRKASSLKLRSISVAELLRLCDALLPRHQRHPPPEPQVALHLIQDFFGPLFGLRVNEDTEATTGEQLHWLSLLVQFLNLAVPLYVQSHIGEFHPHFLKSPLIGITLQGCVEQLERAPYIVAELKNLACLGHMVGDRVFTFRLQLTGSSTAEDSLPYAVYSTVENIVDTWGPASFIADSKAPVGEKLHGLRIGGGVIAYHDVRDGRPLFHWSTDLLGFTPSGKTFSYVDEIMIGAIDINRDCPLDLEQSRKQSGPSLWPCGPEPSTWVLREKQALLQGGQYVTLSVGNVYHKVPKRTLKAWLLDTWSTFGDVRIFNYCFGVQVSLCTGVARRVPLRALIGPHLLEFIDKLKIDGWAALKLSAKNAFMGEADFDQWLESLGGPEYKCIQTVCGKLLELLKDTGFGRNGAMRILWPDNANPYFCVHAVPDRAKCWSRILKDSEWCATFCVATELCLVTEGHRCRKLQVVPWGDIGTILSTTVCPANPESQAIALSGWMLEDKTSYWIGEPGGDTWALARRMPATPTLLLVRQNRFPKFLSRQMWQGRVLRERPDLISSIAEDVFVMRAHIFSADRQVPSSTPAAL